MGYYTGYSLTVKNVDGIDEFERICETIKSMSLMNYAFDQGYFNPEFNIGNFYTYDTVKWYDHDEDMLKIAKQFPNCIFCLEGTGEEWGDIWRHYYKDSQYEYCEGHILYDEPVEIQW